MDKYDRAVEFLTQNPQMIEEVWDRAKAGSHPESLKNNFNFSDEMIQATCLFTSASKDPYDVRYGCLTEIHSKKVCSSTAQTPELTRAIVEDDRLPSNGADIEVNHLPVFAEWQRRIDKELGRI